MQNTEEKRNKHCGVIITFSLILLICIFSFFADWDKIYATLSLKADYEGKLAVSFISVGDADCAYIHLDDTDILIDCGTEVSAENIVNYLKRYGCRSLDAIFISHPDSDHIGGATKIIEKFSTKEIYCYDTPQELIGSDNLYSELNNSIIENNIHKQYVKAGEKYSYGELNFSIISPSYNYDNVNDCSLVIKLSYRGKSILFTGDISSDVETELENKDILADVLKVAHHGSAYSSSEEFLKKVSPKISVISADTDDLYLPDYKTEYRISEISDLYITGRDGNIVITTDGKSLDVQTGV